MIQGLTQINYFREEMVTIKYDHIYDLKKVKIKIMAECKGELADATIDPKHFRALIEQHLNMWSDRAYTTREPVRFIGLQVDKS